MGAYLILASVIIRSLVEFSGQARLAALLILAVYSGLLIAYQRQRAWFAARQPRALMYLVVQTLLIVSLILLPYHFDYLPLLFIPLSLSAVELLGRRSGFLLITAFALIMVAMYGIAPLIFGDADSTPLPTGVAMTLLYSGFCFLVGQIAHVRAEAVSAREHNRQLLSELRVVHRQLQDHSAQLEELATMQERNRLARELHDSVTQTVFSMSLAAQAAQLLLNKDVHQVAVQLERIAELARNASREIQAIVKQLRSASIATEGLTSALQAYLTERRVRDGLMARLEVHGEAQWPENVTLGIYRIVQEAVNNVIKHAGTREVTVTLNLDGQPACVEVSDQGAGFLTNGIAPQRGHMGLASMAERARELGWVLTINSEPGHGTCVKVQER